METPPSTSPAPPLRRRISVATPTSVITSDIPFAIESSTTTPSSFDFDLISIKPRSFVAYTSLRDIISSPSSSSVNLPSINGSSSPVISTVGDISIRDPLVKQAARSYLQATAQTSSGDSAGCQFLRRVWLHFSAGVQFLGRVFDWILRTVCAPPQMVK
ncbi:Uncharacterized protein Rs2_33468 [Raphanus sativus]|uniref:Uncharacterized protein LOC108814984 n=1 Tax=Raphanus sativus TaxID=3726 RepID=A0A6J0K5B7_RAPSA|nr:uncharacterized protein LOC108814984 [Raphanus sativus]KAJ4883375.1 Uncharacterized protein Rs2_33468 [Raphanus sativus]